MEIIELSDPEKITESVNNVKPGVLFNGLKIVYFYSEDLPECHQMSDFLHVLETNDDFEGVCIFKVNTKNAKKIDDVFDVHSVPTFLFYANGSVIDRLIGADCPSFMDKIDDNKRKVHQCTELNKKLENLISTAPVMVFMKGTPDVSHCGDSEEVIALLESRFAKYATFDVLTDRDVRLGLKAIYPQVYVKGKRLGGLEILQELSESGEWDSYIETVTDINTRLKELINRSPIMVFMKGSPEIPRCGFSKNLVVMLNETKLKYDTFDILKNNTVREGLKTYSNWPTYPQVYVKGNLIGGFDIIKELHESDELKSALEEN